MEMHLKKCSCEEYAKNEYTNMFICVRVFVCTHSVSAPSYLHVAETVCEVCCVCVVTDDRAC